MNATLQQSLALSAVLPGLLIGAGVALVAGGLVLVWRQWGRR